MTHEHTMNNAMSLTKIVATLGPASSDKESIRKLLSNGVSVVRFNFSHGDFAGHEDRLKIVRELEEEIGRPIAVLGDLPGPKIRVTSVPDEGIEVVAGRDLIFQRELAMARPGETPIFGCTYQEIVDEAMTGHRVLINDGAIRALVVEHSENEIRCRVTTGGLVTTGKGVNLPDSDISAPAISDRDWEVVEWAIKHRLDFLAMSFVRRAHEVITLKKRLSSLCTETACKISQDRSDAVSMPVIAKIEKPQAVENIEEILEAADGVMVARGDLGVEMDLAQVPITQKMLIRRSQAHGKPCIVATQMLESMIESASPTRAEVSDVANAIYDAADAVMLSGETAVGQYGPQAVDMMRRVAHATENRLEDVIDEPVVRADGTKPVSPTAALAHGAWRIAVDLNATLVACWSEYGETARRLSRFGFHIPVLAFSSDLQAVRRMTLLYAVTPVFQHRPPEHRSDFAKMVNAFVREHKLAELGDTIVVVSGKPMGKPGASDSVTIQKIN